MAEAQVKNYTDEMVATMIDQYTATPTRATVDASVNTEWRVAYCHCQGEV